MAHFRVHNKSERNQFAIEPKLSAPLCSDIYELNVEDHPPLTMGKTNPEGDRDNVNKRDAASNK